MRYITSQMVFLLYKSLLIKYGEKAVLEIFNDEFYVVNQKSISRNDLISLFSTKSHFEVPLNSLLSLYKKTEFFHKKYSYDIHELLSEIIMLRAQAFSISAIQEMLRLLEPYLEEAFTSDNLYLFVFKIIEIVHTYQVPGSSFHLIGHEENDIEGVGCMELFYDREAPGAYAYDITTWKNYIILESPRMIGLPAFENIEVIAECRKVEDILEERPYEIIDGNLLLDGVHIGKFASFSLFLERHTLYNDATVIPDWNGILIEQNVYDIAGTGLQLRKGCFYNAPYVLMKVRYLKGSYDKSRILKQLINANSGHVPVIPDESDYEVRHSSLLSSLTKKVRIEYNTPQQKVSINGTYVLKGFPAQLFWWICNKYVSEGRTEFSYQDIIVDPFFVLDPEKPNITTRFGRLKEKLKNEYDFLNLESTGRGFIHFSTRATLDLTLVK